MDLAAVPVLHELTHLPVIVDPSHATGKRWLVRPLALGGVAVGADGVMVEVHPDPDSALSDAEQQLDLDAVRGADARPRAGPRARPRTCTTTMGRGAGRCAGVARRAVEALSAVAATGSSRRGPRRPTRLGGELRLPGDKSISHRALMLALLADGETTHHAAPATAPTSARPRGSCARLARRWSASPSRAPATSTTCVSLRRCGGLADPGATCSTAATPAPAMRLFAGILAGQPFGGDARRRRLASRPPDGPHHRAAARHGRRDRRPAPDGTRPPLTRRAVGRRCARSTGPRPVPSAQVKSAILLAGLRAAGTTRVRESVATRDHTERMLRARGVDGPDRPRRGRPAVDRDRRRAARACARRARPGRPVGGRVLARGRRDPPGRGARLRGVDVNPTRAAYRPAAADGRVDRGASTAGEPGRRVVTSRSADLVVRIVRRCAGSSSSPPNSRGDR